MNDNFLAAVTALLAILVLCLLGIVLTFPASAHESPTGWSYPQFCCSNQDCNMIPASRVSTKPDGYHINVLPGDHAFIQRATLFIVPYQDPKVKPSPDGEYHLCISPNYWPEPGHHEPSRVICFFAPPPSY